MPYDLTTQDENGTTGLLTPLSGIVIFYRCPAIIYYINKNIHFVNLYKISRVYLCYIPTCNMARPMIYYNHAREVNTTEEQYNGFQIQETENVYFIRDGWGKIVATRETEKDAREWVDEHQ